jgi:hypothetical protein
MRLVLPGTRRQILGRSGLRPRRRPVLRASRRGSGTVVMWRRRDSLPGIASPGGFAEISRMCTGGAQGGVPPLRGAISGLNSAGSGVRPGLRGCVWPRFQGILRLLRAWLRDLAVQPNTNPIRVHERCTSARSWRTERFRQTLAAETGARNAPANRRSAPVVSASLGHPPLDLSSGVRHHRAQ